MAQVRGRNGRKTPALPPANRVKGRIRLAAVLGLVGGIAYVSFNGDSAALSPPPKSATAPLPVEPVLMPLYPEGKAPKSVAKAFIEDRAEAAPATPESTEPATWALPAGAIDVAAAEPYAEHLAQRMPDGSLIHLTLDRKLHEAALKSLRNFRVEYGAAVAIRPKTGEILALAEHAEGRPDLRQLSLGSEGPAASIFKVVTAAALVELADLNHETPICTHGGRRRLTLYHLDDNPKRDRQCETLAESLGTSNNVTFARFADRLLTPQKLEAFAERFLFNRRIPFLWGVGRSKAKIPTGSRLGFAKAAAGFTGTTLSPLHGALVAAAVANKGVMMTPRLVARATRDGEELYRAEFSELARPISAETAREVALMMKTTTVGEGSAGVFFRRRRRPRMPGLEVAGKTGSLTRKDRGVARLYSWFVAFAPADDPEIAVAALVVNGKVWSTKGAVIARDVIKQWYDEYFPEEAKKRRKPAPDKKKRARRGKKRRR